MIRNCLVCDKEFNASPYRIKRKKGLYCSKSCHQHTRKNKIRRVCLFCNKVFYAIPSYVKRGEGKLCSKVCANKFKVGKKHTKEHTKKIADGNRGKKVSDIAKKKMSEARKKFHKTHPTIFSGCNNWNWKGGHRIDRDGYILILSPNHPFHRVDNYILHSRLVMEQMLGRYLKPEEVVHHKGIKYPIDSIKNKQDDRPENLGLFPNQPEHRKFHIRLKYQDLV